MRWMRVVFAHLFPFVPLKFTAICMLFFVRLALNSEFSFFSPPCLFALPLSLSLSLSFNIIHRFSRSYLCVICVNVCFSSLIFAVFSLSHLLFWFGFNSTLAAIITVVAPSFYSFSSFLLCERCFFFRCLVASTFGYF